jgi:hypothetical protein
MESIWTLMNLINSSSDGLRYGRFHALLDAPITSSMARVGHRIPTFIPIAIENNEFFPLGFCIAPSESVARYSTFFDYLIQ